MELGIGHGYSTEFFSNYFKKYVVLDGDKEIINKFKKEHSTVPVNIVETFFEDYCTDEKFDIIICGFVLEHVDDPKVILDKYKELLAPRGKMFITVPNAEALNRRIGVEAGILESTLMLSEHDIRCGHKRYYTVDTLEEVITESGLRTVTKEGIFLKPITTTQMISLDLSDEIIEGMLKVGRGYPELCLGLLFEVERR